MNGLKMIKLFLRFNAGSSEGLNVAKGVVVRHECVVVLLMEVVQIIVCKENNKVCV
jgi:hypothetical protein